MDFYEPCPFLPQMSPGSFLFHSVHISISVSFLLFSTVPFFFHSALSCQQISIVCTKYKFPEAKTLPSSLLFSQSLEMSLSLIDTQLLLVKEMLEM